MRKTKAQLEEENDALRAVLAAIGEGVPPLPADPEKMRLYGLECASRLSMITAYAAGVAGCREDWLPQYAQGHTAAFRQRWARPLHYEPETPKASRTVTGDTVLACWHNAPCHAIDYSDGTVEHVTPPCQCGHSLEAHPIVIAEGSSTMACTGCECERFDGYGKREPVTGEDATAIVAKAIETGLCHYCDIEPATVGDYCEACAPAVQMAAGAIEDATTVIVEDDDGAECTDYDFAYKLHGCELDAGHDGPHRDLVGHEWEEHRCPVKAGEQWCGRAEGHDGEHCDRASGRVMTTDEAAVAIASEAIEFTTDSRRVVTARCTKPEAHGAGLLGGKPKVPVLCDRTEHHAPVTDKDATSIVAKAIETGPTVIVEDDAPRPGEWARRFGPYCTATTVRGTVTYYCDQAPHSEGAHRSPGLCEDDPDITWTDAPEPVPCAFHGGPAKVRAAAGPCPMCAAEAAANAADGKLLSETPTAGAR